MNIMSATTLEINKKRSGGSCGFPPRSERRERGRRACAVMGENPGFPPKKDNWTIVTADGSFATQVEHTILITKKGVEILTKRP